VSIEKATQIYKIFVESFPGVTPGSSIPLSFEKIEKTRQLLADALSHQNIHLAVNSFPKSASRRLVDMFNSNRSMREVNVNASLHAAEADSLDSGYLCACHAENYIVHLHTHCYNTLPLFLKTFDIRTTILTRNIFDTLVSTKEHLDKNMHLAHIVNPPTRYREMEEKDRFNFVIDHVTPWLLKFHTSWALARDNGWVLATWLDYEDIIKAPLDSLRKIFDELNLDDSDFDFESMINFSDQQKSNLNVGISGRGEKTFSDQQIDRIRQIAAPFSEFPLDKIGL